MLGSPLVRCFATRVVQLLISSPVIIVALLARTARSDMHTAGYVFGAAGIVNQTGGWNTGLAFLFGQLSVQWTVRLYMPCFKFNLLRDVTS